MTVMKISSPQWTVESSSSTPAADEIPVQTARQHGRNNTYSANGTASRRPQSGRAPGPRNTNYKNSAATGSARPRRSSPGQREPGYAAQIRPLRARHAPGRADDIADRLGQFQIVRSSRAAPTDVETTPGSGTFGFQGVRTGGGRARNHVGVFADDLPARARDRRLQYGRRRNDGYGERIIRLDANGRNVLVNGLRGTRMVSTRNANGSYQDNNDKHGRGDFATFALTIQRATRSTGLGSAVSVTRTGCVQQNVWQNGTRARQCTGHADGDGENGAVWLSLAARTRARIRSGGGGGAAMSQRRVSIHRPGLVFQAAAVGST